MSNAEKDATRERVVALVADLANTLSDPTQAWDIAVADFEYELDRLVNRRVTETGEPKIEIIHGRDPDSSCELTVFVNGVRTDNWTEVDLDPGRGWERGDWESHKQSSLSSGSPAFLAELEPEFEAFGESSYIEGTREEWVRGMAEDFLAKNEHAQGWESDDTDDWEPDCDVLSQEFIEFCTKTYDYTPRLVHVRPPVETGEMYSDHWFVAFDDIAVDFTARQFYNVPQPPVDPDTIPIPLIFEWHGGVHSDTYPLDYVTFAEVKEEA